MADTENKISQVGEKVMSKKVTRRQAIQAAGIGVVGLAFAAPIISSIKPKKVFAATYGPSGFCIYQVTEVLVAAGCPAGLAVGKTICVPAPCTDEGTGCPPGAGPFTFVNGAGCRVVAVDFTGGVCDGCPDETFGIKSDWVVVH